MIEFHEGYRGLALIKSIVEGRIGGKAGIPNADTLHVIGKKFPVPIMMPPDFLPNTDLVKFAGFIVKQTGLDIGYTVDSSLPWRKWISLSREIRASQQNNCAKIILTAYAAINGIVKF